MSRLPLIPAVLAAALLVGVLVLAFDSDVVRYPEPSRPSPYPSLVPCLTWDPEYGPPPAGTLCTIVPGGDVRTTVRYYESSPYHPHDF
jgi:hypothetical protein